MIGIFDSGIGGLTVAKQIKRADPDQRLVYFGDAARYPWGDKSPETIRAYTVQISDFLIGKGVREIVIACNTASTFAADFLRRRYPDVRFYDVIDPVISRIAEELKSRQKLRVGVIGTRGTINSGIYQRKLEGLGAAIRTYAQACPLFVPLAEEGMTAGQATDLIVEKYLAPLKKKDIDILVLGCTHYPLLEKAIRKFIGPSVVIVSSAEEAARRIGAVPARRKKSGRNVYYFSDLTEHRSRLARKIMDRDIVLSLKKF